MEYGGKRKLSSSFKNDGTSFKKKQLLVLFMAVCRSPGS